MDRDTPGAAGPKRMALLVAGFGALVLAVVGAIVPVMPASPFILLAAYCFARSSRRCHSWLTKNRIFGRHVSHLVEGRPLSWPLKVALLASCWLTAVVSAVFLAPNLAVRLSSLSIAAAMSAYVLLRGRRQARPTTTRRRSSAR